MEATERFGRWPPAKARGSRACPAPSPMHVRSGSMPRQWACWRRLTAIDADIIARFARAKNLQPTPSPSFGPTALESPCGKASAAHRRSSVQKQRRSSLLDNAEMLASLDEVIALLTRQSRTLEGEIASLIDDDPLWACLAGTFRSLKGVAYRTVARLMAQLPEIGTSPTRPLPSSSAWRRSPMTAAAKRRRGQSAVVVRVSARSCSWSPPSPHATISIWRAFATVAGCRKGKNGHPHRARPQAARHSQCKSTRRANRIRQCNLTPQIVAHPSQRVSRD